MKPVDNTIGVMLIDDHPMMLWGLSKLIQGERPRMDVVGTARSCEDALARVAHVAPDVIVLDLDLGGQNSIDILPALLAIRPAHVLILTAGRDQAMLDLAVIRGARGVMSKDAPAEQIIKAIGKLHQGELWLDHETIGRVLGGLVRPVVAGTPDPERMKQDSLTVKERKIIQMLVEQGGVVHKALAQQLFISEHTLRNHLTSIYQKLEVGNRLELYVYAVKHRLGMDERGDQARTSAMNPDTLMEGKTNTVEKKQHRTKRLVRSLRNPPQASSTHVI